MDWRLCHRQRQPAADQVQFSSLTFLTQRSQGGFTLFQMMT